MTDDRINLVRPDEATGKARAVFDDILAERGPSGLTPTWGFFALQPDLLEHWWGLVKRIESHGTKLGPKLLHAVALVCAAEVGCPRCINNHQTQLIERYGMTPEDIADALSFEIAESVSDDDRAVLRFAKKVAFGESVGPDDLAALREIGFDDADVSELISVALIETALARRSLAVTGLDDAEDWPRENLPSANYVS